MKTINYVLLLIGMIGFTTCYSQTNTNKPPVKIWDKTFGGNDREIFKTLISTSDKGFILSALSYSGVSGDKSTENKGKCDLWIVKIDSNGIKKWDRTFGDIEYNETYRIVEAKNDGFILIYYSNGIIETKSRNEIKIIKINFEGEKEWTRIIENDNSPKYTISTMDDGILLIGNNSSETLTNDIQSNYLRDSVGIWFIKINNQGKKEWKKILHGYEYETPNSIKNTSDSGFIFTASVHTGIGNKKSNFKSSWDLWVIKLNSTCDIIWDKTFGGSRIDGPESIINTSDKGYFVLGSSNSENDGSKTETNKGDMDFWVIKLDSNGNKLWDKSFGGDKFEYGCSIFSTKDEGFIIAGSSMSGISGDKTEANNGYADFWVMKMNSKGDKIWDKTLGGDDIDRAYSIIDIQNNCFVIAGETNSSLSGDKTEKSKGDQDIWLVKLGFQ